jgi:iron complex transport system ATP-binding protein
MKLDVEKISWSVDKRKIVDNVLLDVQPGEFVGLLGPNGSGKSSLLRTIYRVLRPDAGQITLGGEDIWKLDARQVARRAAVVAQERGSEFDFLVHEIVMMGRTPHKGMWDQDQPADYQLVEDALRQVGMVEFAQRNFRTLSGGEKQRVLVARALVQQAKFLVLDEPTNHLDIRYQLEILLLVKQLQVTTLAALHDLNLAAQFCDRIFLLQDGSVVASGTPADVLQPQRIRQVYHVDAHIAHHPITQQLQIAFSPLPAEKLQDRLSRNGVHK